MPKTHRWQPTGYTTCGRRITPALAVNLGRFLDDGVTCAVCRRSTHRVSMLNDDWNGQSDGAPDRRTPAEQAEAQRLAAERERCWRLRTSQICRGRY